MLYIIIFLILVIILLSFLLFRSKLQRENTESELINFKSVVDIFPDFVYLKDRESRFIYVNKAQTKLLNLKKPEDAIGKSDFDFFEDSETLFKNEQRIINTLENQVNFIHTVDFQGNKIILSDTKIPLLNKYNECTGIIGISRDITELQYFENESNKNKIKYKAIFEHAPLAIFYSNTDLLIIDFNKRFTELFNCTESDKGQLTFTDIIDGESISKVVGDTILITNEANFELVFNKKDKKSFTGNIVLTVIEDETGNKIIEGIIEDVSTMVKARNEIIKAKDSAVKANQLKSKFLANLSHEIRTPINAIIGFANMISDSQSIDKENQEFLEIIKGSSILLLNLIDSIIDFSKLETNQLVFTKSKFNFENLFNDLAINTKKMLTAYGKTNIQLKTKKPDPANIKLNTSRDLLKQAILQLLMNATKFTTSGEINFGYQLHKNKLEISIQDTGCGITKEKQLQITKQLNPLSLKQNFMIEGTGVGLTLTGQILKLLEGTIQLSSKENEGSKFVIIFNLEDI